MAKNIKSFYTASKGINPPPKKNEVKKKASGFPYESLALAFDFLARYNQLDFVAF